MLRGAGSNPCDEAAEYGGLKGLRGLLNEAVRLYEIYEAKKKEVKEGAKEAAEVSDSDQGFERVRKADLGRTSEAGGDWWMRITKTLTPQSRRPFAYTSWMCRLPSFESLVWFRGFCSFS